MTITNDDEPLVTTAMIEKFESDTRSFPKEKGSAASLVGIGGSAGIKSPLGQELVEDWHSNPLRFR